jgi:hypothetical protein
MTDRLSVLLREEAAAIDVPPVPGDLLAAGHRELRHRRTRTTLATTLVVLLVTVGAAATVSQWLGGDETRGVAPAGPSTGHGAVFTLGTTVFWDGGTRHVSIDDKAIKSTYYTSAGLLVRHGNNNASDGGGPQRFSLVTPDGTVEPVSVVTEEVVPGVEPTQPYLTYAEVVDGEVQVVVHDVATDEEVARVPVPGKHTWGGWSAPPVALSGDRVYVGTNEKMLVVNWRTGLVVRTDTIPPGYPDVKGGRAVTSGGGRASVVDAETGKTLLSVDAGQFGYFFLSPDGRFASIDAEDGKTVDVYDVDAQTKVSLPGQSYDYGWSPDGDLFRVKGDQVITCSTSTGECTSETIDLPAEGGGVAPQDLRYGNKTYES